MHLPLKFIILSLALFLITGCSTTNKIAALKPQPDDAGPVTYESATSYIGMPVSIKLKDIENQVNRLMTGLIYEDKNIEDDDIQMQVWKLAPITLLDAGGKIKTVLPLKAQVKYRVGTNKLGVNLYDVREFNFNGNVTLLSKVGLSNWKLNTDTSLESLDWNESPTTSVMGKQVPITYLINPAIRLFKSKIERSIDQSIAKSMDFKPNVLDALDVLCQPRQLSEAYQSWLRIVPSELYTTEAKFSKGVVSLDMGLKGAVETVIGAKPSTKFDREKIVLKPVSKMPQQLVANVVAVSTYADASRIITGNFKGQEFGSGKRKVTVQNVALWHKGGKMVVALDLLGSVNGTIYLSGFPQYNAQTQEIYFDQLDYVLDTKSTLLKTANWLAEGVILRKIREACRYSIKPNLDEGRKEMQQYMKNYSPVPGVFVNGKLEGVEFSKIELTNKAILAFLKINGDLSVSVDGLK